MKRLVGAFLLPSVFAASVVAQPSASPTQATQAQSSEARWNDATREKLAQRLGLTPDQRAKLQAFRKDHPNHEDSFEQERSAHNELREMLEKDTATDDQITKRANELSKMMVDHNMERVQRMLAIRKILTPDQRVKFREFLDERREERGVSDEHDHRGPKENQDRQPFRARLRHRFDTNQ